MSEGAPNQYENVRLEEEKMISLARELNESSESFPFPGLDPDAYAKLKADNEDCEEMSDYDFSTPTIDEQIERLRSEGIKVVLVRSSDGTYGRTVIILLAGSNDVNDEFFLPRHFQTSEEMDPRLKELIVRGKKINEYFSKKQKNH